MKDKEERELPEKEALMVNRDSDYSWKMGIRALEVVPFYLCKKGTLRKHFVNTESDNSLKK